MTYEPQVNSDVFAMFQSEVEGRIVDWSLLTKDVPPRVQSRSRLSDQHARLGRQRESASSRRRNKTFPRPVNPVEEMEAEGYREMWITYGTPYYSAKELTVLPKRSVTIKDSAAYGVILTQGYGTFGKQPVSTPSMIRFGEMTRGRGLRHRGCGEGRCAHRKSQRIRSARHSEAFRAGQSGRRTSAQDVE